MSLTSRSAVPSDGQIPARHREVLLATDASREALAATRVTSALATRWSITPRVCTVAPIPSIALDAVGASIVSSPQFQAKLGDDVRSQIESCTGSASGWPCETAVGVPATEILRLAEGYKADLIVLGLHPHTFLDRIFRDETALTIMRHASVPVLAVTPLLSQLPRRIAVAVDFSRASIAAARAATTLLDDEGSLFLVYVEPPAEPRSPRVEGFATIFAQGVAAAFSRLQRELARLTGARIETVVLHGGVAPALLSFAERAEIDLLAVGSQRHSVAHRAVVGNVTTALARAATRSLLVLPPNWGA